MRALWSRATQIPGTCRCISCASRATVPARRRGAGSLGGSWALKTPTSTFLYTTVFAAALAVDARAKAKRNQQWDDAFAQLQGALDRPSDTTRTEKEDSHIEESDSDVSQHLTDNEVADNAATQEGHVPVDKVAPFTDVIRFDSRMPGAQALAWPANTGPDLIPHNLPPQSLWAPDELRRTALRRRHTRKKLAMQELATALLIHTLIRDINLGRFQDSAFRTKHLLDHLSPTLREVAVLAEDEAKTTQTELVADINRLHHSDASNTAEAIARARLHVTHGRVPSYYQDADGDFHGICKQMNESIARLFQRCGKGNDREKAVVVAKICHNLLVSTAAPDLQTFNILMSGFVRWDNSKLVESVITAFYTCKVRPNEFLCKQILDFYAAQSRPDDFSRFVGKMRGVGDALSLAHPRVNVNEASQGRLLRINENKVYQKVHPTPMVFGALVDGVVKFAGFDRALDVYYEMRTDGWGLAIPSLIKLLRDCIRRADWEGGTYVWGEINSIKTKVKPSYAARAYHHMLSLCSVTGNTIAFNQVLNEVAKRGFDQKAIIKEAMITTRWAQDTREYLAPAWAADNLMIAVSGYVNDATSSSDNVTESATEEDDFDEEPSPDPQSDPNIRPALEEQAVDPKEAWSKWVEHEVGEKPKDPKL
jgi:hypothetical protein